MRSTPATYRIPTGLAAAALLMAGCLGDVGQPGGQAPGPAGPPSSSPGGRPGGAPTTGSPDMPPGPAAKPSDGTPPVTAPGAVAPVPLRRLTRAEYARTIRELLGIEVSPKAAFVPDEVVDWFENDAAALTTSPVLAEQYLDSAQELAARALGERLASLVPCAAMANDLCAQQFVRDFGQRAFRRPLTPEERATYEGMYEAGAADGGFRAGLELSLRGLLVAPQFVFRVEVGEEVPGRPGARRPTSYEMASRLSYALWGTMPDAELFAAAARNALVSPADIRAQAERLLADPRAKSALASFFRQWLDLPAIDQLDKLTTVFPAWKASLPALYRREVDAFLDDAFWGAGTIAALYTGARSQANAELARVYGVVGPKGTAFEPITFDPGQRAGLLTLAGIQAAHASNDQTSPTLRGAFVRQRILCKELPPPPPNVNNQRPPLSAVKTTRERVNQHATDTACASCHALIDPIGFGFERYDGMGMYRERENGLAIDDSGNVAGTSIGAYKGPLELVRKIAASPEAAACLAEQLYRHAVGRRVQAGDGPTLASLSELVRGAEAGSLRRLLVALTGTDAFLLREATAPQGGRP